MGRLIVKKYVKKFAKRKNIEKADSTDGNFCDLMANIEGEVQNLLKDEGITKGGQQDG